MVCRAALTLRRAIVTDDFARLMQAVKEVRCCELAEAIVGLG